MGLIAWRIALVAGGLFLLAANQQGNQPGTLFGFYPPTNAGRIGYDLSHGVILALALWLIACGITGRKITFRRKPKDIDTPAAGV